MDGGANGVIFTVTQFGLREMRFQAEIMTCEGNFTNK